VAVFEAEGVGTQEFLTLIFPGALDRITGLETQILKLWGAGADSAHRRNHQPLKIAGRVPKKL